MFLFEEYQTIDDDIVKVYSNELNKEILIEKDILRKVVRSGNVNRYKINYTYLILFPYYFKDDKAILLENDYLEKNYPLANDYLEKTKNKLKNRENGAFNDAQYYRYGRSQNISKWEQTKIMVPYMLNRLSSGIDFDNNYYFVNVTTGGYGITLKNSNNYKVVSLLLNSKLLDFYFKVISSKFRGGYFGANKSTLTSLPIKLPETKDEFINYYNLIKDMIEKSSKYINYSFDDFINKYTSESGKIINKIINKLDFYNKIYSGRARKIRNFTVNINTNIITIYLDKSSSGKYEVLKFEENDKNKRKYIKYYLENLTDEQLDEIDNKYKGNILNKTLQIEIPDYNKDHVVKKVVKEWSDLQKEILNLEEDIRKIDNEIDQMVYNLYDLTEEEIKIVENS